MKGGSMVECVNAENQNIGGLVYGGIYIVTDFFDDYALYVDGFNYPHYNWRFREIEFPPSLESEIKESLTRQLELV
jgi:hypothetical protein